MKKASPHCGLVFDELEDSLSACFRSRIPDDHMEIIFQQLDVAYVTICFPN